MKFEEVMPALRAGKKARVPSFTINPRNRTEVMYTYHLLRDDWEVIENPTSAVLTRDDLERALGKVSYDLADMSSVELFYKELGL